MPLQSAATKTPALDCCFLDSPYFTAARHLLLFTQADGTTTGFPPAWLYQVKSRQDAQTETLTFTLTEHRVTVTGRGLDRLLGQLKDGEGFHASAQPERYSILRQGNQAHISSITIEPLSPTPPQDS